MLMLLRVLKGRIQSCMFSIIAVSMHLYNADFIRVKTFSSSKDKETIKKMIKLQTGIKYS